MTKKLFLIGLMCCAFAHSKLTLAGTVEGSVRDLDGRPVTGAMVYASNIGHRRGTTTISDSSGTFVLRNLKAGTYEVHAYKESAGYADTFFAFFGVNNKAVKVVQVPEAGTSNIVLMIGPKCARLKLSINNEEGKPVDGELTLTRVSATNAPYGIGVNSKSDTLLPPVLFRFEVRAKGYQLWRSGILRPRTGEALEVTVRLTRSRPN